MNQLFVNSGTFESLDACLHWANKQLQADGVLYAEAHDLIRIIDDAGPRYRMALRLAVTEDRWQCYLNEVTDEPMAWDETRCRICGWPLAKSAEEGCVLGNCSMRPKPKVRADAGYR